MSSIDPESEPGGPHGAEWRFVGDQLTQIELADRAAGRWLTSSAGLMLIASLVGALIAVALISLGQPTVVDVLLAVGIALSVAAAALSGMTLLSGGDDPDAGERLDALRKDLDATPENAVRRYVDASLPALRKHEHRKRRRAFLLRTAAGLLLIAAFVAGLGLATTAGDEDTGDDEATPGAEVVDGSGPAPPALSDRALAERFRPYLLFDSGEGWRPLDVERFFAEGHHKACVGRAPCETLGGASDLTRFTDAATVLNVNGERERRPGLYRSPDAECRQTPKLHECDRGGPARLYYHVVRSGGRTYVDYWWYLRYNDADPGTSFDHQSDWEGVVVAVDERNPSTFDWVGFAAHGPVWRYFREDLSCEGSREAGSCGTSDGHRFGQRVSVFVAHGTHAAYPVPCQARRRGRFRLCVQNKRVGVPLVRFRLPERGFDGKRAWGANDDQEALAPLAGAVWTEWPGKWDPTKHVNSPGRQARYRFPGKNLLSDCPKDLCRRVRPKGYERACFGWFGPGAAVTACDPVTLRSGVSGGSATFSLRRQNDPSPSGAGSPGVAQLTGGYLTVGQEAVLEGRVPATAELYARVREGDNVLEARFIELGLEEGGAAVLTTKAGPTLELRYPDGRTREPEQKVQLTGAG
jgi:hypothetical protein